MESRWTPSLYWKNQITPLIQVLSVICTSKHIVCHFKYTSADGSFHGHLNIQGESDLVPDFVTSRVAQVKQFEL